MNIETAFPSRFLKAADLQGKTVGVAMDQVVIEEMGAPGKKDEKKPVLYFVGKEKGLVLNRTNSRVIAKAYGTETARWRGQRLLLYVTEVEAFGDMVDAIRVRIPNGQPPAQEPPPAEEPPAEVMTGMLDGDADNDLPF